MVEFMFHRKVLRIFTVQGKEYYHKYMTILAAMLGTAATEGVPVAVAGPVVVLVLMVLMVLLVVRAVLMVLVLLCWWLCC